MLIDKGYLPDISYLREWREYCQSGNILTTTPPNPLVGVERAPLKDRLYRAIISWKSNDGPYDTYDDALLWRNTGGMNVVVTDHLRGQTPEYRVSWLPVYGSGSGDGHSWGYIGSGSSRLATDILLDALDEWPSRAEMDKGFSLARTWRMDFRDLFVASWPQDREWRMSGERIAKWLDLMRKADPDTPRIIDLERQVCALEVECAQYNGRDDDEAVREVARIVRAGEKLWDELAPLYAQGRTI
jgi:hypothetical protein